MNFKNIQMNVKNLFLNAYIQEEVYVYQPPDFLNSIFLIMFSNKKTLYGLKEAPWAWYDWFSKFMLENNFQRGKVDKTLFIKKIERDILWD